MHAASIADIVPARLRAIGGIGVLSVAMLAGTAGAVSAASVTPTPINDGNPTCSDFDSTWSQLKVDGGLGDGTFSDGTLTVTISNYQNSDSGNPGSFDWSSNIGVDAVFVKAGNDKHNLFVYDPESTGDTDLGPQAGQGNGISHISFCYDGGDEPTDEPPVDEPPVEEPPTDEPPVDEPPVEEPPTTPEQPTPTPTGEVQGVTGTPDPTLPPTDTLAAGESTGSPLPALLVILSIVTLTGIITVRMPTRSRR
ncbi:MAG TPA: hypothetical protein VFV72_00485 [Candidatus Limnocylindrales bacterium]|nr:hypothetical protein [Candidatus Limnocylindrales bacterium]